MGNRAAQKITRKARPTELCLADPLLPLFLPGNMASIGVLTCFNNELHVSPTGLKMCAFALGDMSWLGRYGQRRARAALTIVECDGAADVRRSYPDYRDLHIAMLYQVY